ncbi:TPA: hypothetical protein DEP21_03415 [Patescibacteria group bacterium]|nr:hypothetical protein [Candidatus Gracilibacteria bacterium]
MKLLKRYTDNIYFLFDSDQAGQSATIRALNIAYQQDIFPKKIKLPKETKDADDLANIEGGKDIFEECFKHAQDGFVATFEQLKANHDLSSPIDKQKVLNTLFSLIQNINNVSIQQHYIQTVSDLIHSPFEITRSQYNKYTKTDGKLNTYQRTGTQVKTSYQP